VPLTDLIEQDLLATLDGTGDPRAVQDGHAGSKGPLYAALARATGTATLRFAEVRGKLREAGAHLREATATEKESEARAAQAEHRAAGAEKRLAAAESALAQRQTLLARADGLTAAGFAAAHLDALGGLLGAVAEREGLRPADPVARFLAAAQD